MNKAYRVSRNTMIRAAAIMEFLRANAHATAQVVADKFSIKPSAARYALAVLVSGDKVEKVHHKRKGLIPSPDTFIIGGDATPLEISGDDPLFTVDLKEKTDATRIVGPARQIGLKRDPLIEALFGKVEDKLTRAPA